MDDVSVRARQTLASFLLVALIVVALPAMARGGRVVLSGAGTVFTTTTGDTASFSVSVSSNTATGSTSGTVSDESAGIVAAPVTCLDVRGDDRVVIGGVAETNSLVPEPIIFAFYLVDGGMPGAGVDIIGGEAGPSRGSVADAAFCRARAVPFTSFAPIASGEITIRIRGRTASQGS
jgi:hypothetical protein